VETLLIGGALDVSTPPQIASRELLPYLPNGHEFVLPAFGHSMTIWAEQPQAGAHLINAFLDRGVVDGSLYTEQRLDFDVGVRSFPTMAKALLGLMLGFVTVAVMLLLWMASRVIRVGGFGRRTSIALRTLSPLPLGLGGWFLAVLLVMIVWPAIFLGSQALAVISMGIPIGLGVYLAWVSRDAQYVGLPTAIAAALIGAWAGFNATGGLTVIVTTLVGAGVAANLALIVLDIAWDTLPARVADVAGGRVSIGHA
jgi:hypothetical protein